MSDVDFVSFQLSRSPGFEFATVEDVEDATGAPGAFIRTPGRDYGRSRAGVASGLGLGKGDRVLLIAGGKQDVPLALGKVPYIF